MAQVSSSFILRSKYPNFERDSFEKLSDMRDVPSTWIDEGHISYCVETGKHYIFSTKNSNSGLERWIELSFTTDDNERKVINVESYDNLNSLIDSTQKGTLVYITENNEYYYHTGSNFEKLININLDERLANYYQKTDIGTWDIGTSLVSYIDSKYASKNDIVTNDALKSYTTEDFVKNEIASSLTTYMSIDSFNEELNYNILPEIQKVENNADSKLTQQINNIDSKFQNYVTIGSLGETLNEYTLNNDFVEFETTINNEILEFGSEISNEFNNKIDGIESKFQDYVTIGSLSESLNSRVDINEFNDFKSTVDDKILNTKSETLNTVNGRINEVDSKFQDYVTIGSLGEKLNEYVPTATFNSTLSNYADRDELHSKFQDYVTIGGLDEKLNEYVPTSTFNSTLSNYVTNNSFKDSLNEYVNIQGLNTKLNGYVPTSTFNSTLSNYVDREELHSKFQDYVSINGLEGRLNDYVTIGGLDSRLNSYITNNSLKDSLNEYVNIQGLNTRLNEYVPASTFNLTLNDYVTINGLNEKLSGYVHVATFNSSLRDYVTIGGLDSRLNSYINISDLNSSLRDYVTIGGLDSRLNSYINISDLNSQLQEYAKLVNVNTKLQDYVTNERFNGFETSVTDRINEAKNEFNDRINAHASSTDSKLQEYAKLVNVNTKLQDYVTNERFNEFGTSVTNRINEAKNELNNKINTHISSTDSKLQSYITTASVDSKLNNYVTNERFNEFGTSVTNRINEAKDEVNEKINTHISSTDSKLQSYVTLNKLDTELTNYVTKEEYESNSIGTEVINDIKDINNKISAVTAATGAVQQSLDEYKVTVNRTYVQKSILESDYVKGSTFQNNAAITTNRLNDLENLIHSEGGVLLKSDFEEYKDFVEETYAKPEDISSKLNNYAPAEENRNKWISSDLAGDLSGLTGQEVASRAYSYNAVLDQILFGKFTPSVTDPYVEVQLKEDWDEVEGLINWYDEENKIIVVKAGTVGPDGADFIPVNIKDAIISYPKGIDLSNKFTNGVLPSSNLKQNSVGFCKIKNENGEWDYYKKDNNIYHVPTTLDAGEYRYYIAAYFQKGSPVVNNEGFVVKEWNENVAVESENYITILASKPTYYNTKQGFVENPIVFWKENMEDYMTLPPTCHSEQIFKLPRKIKELHIWNDIKGDYALVPMEYQRIEGVITDNLIPSYFDEILEEDGYYMYKYKVNNHGHRGEIKIKVIF